MILALLAGMFGMTPVRPAHAATIMVTNTNASGPGSLASAIANVNFSETIVIFDPSLAGQTITFASQINLNTVHNLTIDGSGLNPQVIVSGGNITGILKISGNTTVNISNIAFTQSVSEDGGVIEITGGIQLNLENCAFYQNQASSLGGAISAVSNSEVNITNCTFEQNQAGGSGGALFLAANSTATIVNSKFMNNSAGGNGGALSGGNIILIDSTLSRNRANRDGGAIYSHWLNIKNTTINRNQAIFAGGAIALEGVNNSLIFNSTVFENQAGDTGGAISAQGTINIDVSNSTFAGNDAPEGSELSLRSLVTIDLYNTILACIPGNIDCIYNTFGGVGTLNSIIEKGTLATFGLSDLADNGGFTQTIALLPGSPLIDAGDDSICANSSVNNLDQRGVARPQGSHCDIGAYEDQSLVRFVKQDAAGTGDGSSWSNAHTDLQSALAAASTDEEIWVAAGTYKPTFTTDRTISFTLKNGVAIYGGFAGMEIARTQRDYETNVTILSGDIGNVGENSDNSYHVVVGSNTNSSAILDGFTVTAGNAKDIFDGSPESRGGGLYINKGSPQLNQLIFTDNHAGFGGGIYASHTEGGNTAIDLILTNVVFRNNTASGEGGGIATLFFPDLSSASFRLSLTDVIFENNTAARTGGGMINNGGELELVNVNFSGNTAAGGGGLSNIPFKPSILTNVTFSNNSASDGGGGMLIGSSGPILSTLTNVTFSNNSTNMNGGGIANAGYSDLLLTNVTFSDNTALANGGGISNGGFFDIESGGTVNLINTTFSNNAANSSGGAIYNESGNISIYNSILYGDTGGEIFDSSGTAVVTYSIVQGGYTGVGNMDEDPLLGPLQDNGGFTQTMALEAGSPAINGGDNANCPTTDQRGITRPHGSHCDIGAYEYNGLDSAVDVIIGNTEIDSYVLSPHESQRQSFPGINSGPVKIINTGGVSIMAAERVIYEVGGVNTSFTELMGLSEGQLDDVYWLPWYNNVDLDTQLRFANTTTSTVTVRVFIGGEEMDGSPFTLAAGESTRRSFPGINAGPVRIESDQNIVAAERVIYKVNGVATSFSEMMALPDNQVDTTYWLPWYNNRDLNTQLRIANVSPSPATVTVTIDGVAMPSLNLAVGESTRVSYKGVNAGPVLIESDQDIVAAERLIYKVNDVNTSFTEMMALPEGQLDTTFWLPWYNHRDLNTQLRFANTTMSTATVHIYISGVEMDGSPFTLPAGQSTRVSFTSVNDGPVQIVSDQDIVAAERLIYKVNGINTSFSEMMALPDGQLDTTYWFPWYNNKDLDTQLRFGLP